MIHFLRKRWHAILIAAVCVLVIGYFLICALIAPIIGQKLKDAIAAHLSADVKYDSLTYRFPYSVHIDHLHLISDEAHGHIPLLEMDRLNLTLAQIPHAGQPIVVKNLELIAPVVHLVKTAAGFSENRGLSKSASQPGNQPPRKLSDMFELRHFRITDGEIIYEDRSDPSSEAESFAGIAVDMGVTPKSKALYVYHVVANGTQRVNLDASGTFDVDQLLLNIDQFTTRANTSDRGGQSGLPPRFQKMLSDAGVTGQAELLGKATLPLRDMQHARYSCTFSLHNGGARFGQSQDDLKNLNLSASLDGTGSQATVRLAKLDAMSGAFLIRVDPFSAQSDNDTLALSDVKIRFGNDQWILNQARFSRDPGDHHLIIRGIDGHIIFASPRASYPAALGQAFRQFGPIGTYAFNGSADFHHQPSTQPTVDLAIQTNGSSATLTTHDIAMTNVVGDLYLTNTAVEIKRIEGNTLNGKIVARGTFVLIAPHGYRGEFVADAIDLDQFAQAFAIRQSESGKLSGRANATIKFNGKAARDSLTNKSTLTADGRLEIADGQLWQISMLTDIADQVGIKREALVASEAAAVFHIEDEIVHLRHAAISSPVLGLQGSGTIGFDKVVDLDVIAAPLGDWKEHLKSTNIPIISDVAGDVAGSIQKLVGAATKKLLYEFHVTGSASDPRIHAIPAPVLTKNAAGVFGKMLREIKAHDLLDSMDSQQ